MKIIQLSDLHLIGDEDHSLYGIDPYLRLKKAFESIVKWHSDATFVAITGDLTDKASSSAYDKLKEIIEESKLLVYPILGNHDKREIFNRSFSNLTNDDFVQYAKKIDGKVFIFLDTLVEDSPYGDLCHIRLEWFRCQLDKYREYPVYVFMHHHPIKSGLYDMDNFANLKSSELFWNLLSNYKNINHIFFGHLHRIMHATKQGISLSSTRSTTFQVAYRPDNKAEFLTNHENPAYAVIDMMKDDSVRVHHHEFMDEDRLYIGDC